MPNPINIGAVGGADYNIGQQLASESAPVVLASDQPAIDVNVVSGGGGSVVQQGARDGTAQSWHVVADTEAAGIGIGAAADAAAVGNGSAISQLKRIRDLLTGGTPGTSVGVVPNTEAAGVGIGAAADAAAVGNGSAIGQLKRIRDLLAAGLPAALVGGRLDVNIGGTSVDVTVTPKAGVVWDVSDRAGRVLGSINAVPELRAATLVVTGTAAVNTGVTATLPAAGAGLFHYITSIELTKLYSVVGVAAGAGVIITSTNLGGIAWTTEQLASAAGTAAKVIDYKPTTPLKSAVANTATTFVAPAQLQTIWRWNITYFTAT